MNKFEEKKLHNAPFLTAFGHFMIKMGKTQKELAEMIGCTSPQISDYRSGKKRVSSDTMDGLIQASGGKIYKNYLLGLSPYMLLENVPNDEVIADKQRMENPDYDLLQKNKRSFGKNQSWGDFISSIVIDYEHLRHDLVETIEQNQKLHEDLLLIIAENKRLRDDLSNLVAEIKEIKSSIHKPVLYDHFDESLPMAAEERKND